MTIEITARAIIAASAMSRGRESVIKGLTVIKRTHTSV
jgi:hypothetical protein